MTSSVRTSAPGKLILIGEYAVLEGWPAAVMAVDRRAHVSLDASPGGRWSFFAPGLVEAPAACSIDARGELTWEGDDRELGMRFALVATLMKGLAEKGIIDPGALEPAAAVLDTRAFFDGRHKLGLGSSAALAVALACALRTWASGEFEPSDSWLRTLVDLHRGVQGGRGSGVDVAASLLGGVLRFQLEARAAGSEKGAGQVCVVEPLALPKDLCMAVVWSGRSASTTAYLERLQARRGEEPHAVEAVLAGLGSIATEAVDALEEDRSTTFLQTVEAFWSGLEELERLLGVPVLSEPHRRLHELAASCGCVYKPSGAGGGDLGVAFTTDPEVAAAMRRESTAAGFSCLDLGPGHGVAPVAVAWQ